MIQPVNADAAIAEVEASNISSSTDGSIKIPKYCILNNYSRLPSWKVIERSYEDCDLYFMVFKPLNKTYDSKFNGMDHVRKKIGAKHKAVIITREIHAKKVHYNAMVFTDKDLSKLHDKSTNRYMIYSKKVPYLDKYKIHDYIVKESHTRYFHGFVDFTKPDIYVKC